MITTKSDKLTILVNQQEQTVADLKTLNDCILDNLDFLYGENMPETEKDLLKKIVCLNGIIEEKINQAQNIINELDNLLFN